LPAVAHHSRIAQPIERFGRQRSEIEGKFAVEADHDPAVAQQRVVFGRSSEIEDDAREGFVIAGTHGNRLLRGKGRRDERGKHRNDAGQTTHFSAHRIPPRVSA